MASNHVASSARTALNYSSNLAELGMRLQGLSIGQKRSFHASCVCFKIPGLHNPPDAASKSKGASGPGSSGRPANSTNKKKSRADLEAERAEKERQERLERAPQRGGLASTSLFANPITTTTTPKPAEVEQEKEPVIEPEIPRNPETLAHVLDPRPRARALWQRKMLVRSLQKRGRLTRAEQILQTERFHLCKSVFFKTSIKKLAPLARQIAGKTIDEAILQMRFSKKKVAQDVRAHLIQARNEAIVAKGMGLGSLPASLPDPKDTEIKDPSEVMTTDISILPLSPTHNPTLKVKRTIATPETTIYIAEAWVNRGAYGMEMEPRAMGRTNILRPPTTGISVLLREERTRSREKADKEAKDQKRRLGDGHWRQLVDKKVYAQRQYYTW